MEGLTDVGGDGLGGCLSVLPSPRQEERGNWVDFDACDISMREMPDIGQSQSQYIFPSFPDSLRGLCMVGLGGGHLSILILLKRGDPEEPSSRNWLSGGDRNQCEEGRDVCRDIHGCLGKAVFHVTTR